MYIQRKAGGVTLQFEWRLCIGCKRMFNLNTNAHLMSKTKSGLWYYCHYQCPKAKKEPPFLEVKT